MSTKLNPKVFESSIYLPAPRFMWCLDRDAVLPLVGELVETLQTVHALRIVWPKEIEERVKSILSAVLAEKET